MSAEELQKFASIADTSIGYLWQVAYGYKRIGPEFALRLEKASHNELAADDLCPDFPWDQAAGHGRCPNCDN